MDFFGKICYVVFKELIFLVESAKMFAKLAPRREALTKSQVNYYLLWKETKLQASKQVYLSVK